MSPLVSRQTCGKENVLGAGVSLISLISLAVLLTRLCFCFCVQEHRGNNLHSVSIESTTHVFFPCL